MIIGIDASRAFLVERTGIEEYSYQVLRNLVGKLDDHQVVLYVTKYPPAVLRKQGGRGEMSEIRKADWLPKDWKIKVIKWPRLWTQVGLSLELLFSPVDVLFVPSHTVPIIHPDSTVVTVHGLEYEKLPWAYSFWERLYMRLSIKASCRWAKKIVAVSENTKKDLMELYQVPEEKVEVVYEGVNEDFQYSMINTQSSLNDKISNFQLSDKYILFIGRLEERKNIIGIVRAFEVLKETYHAPHKLVLAGKFGFGEEKIRREIANVNCTKDIILAGFVSEKEKWELLQNADVFLFPTFYEGFGLPILEAQSVGVPVIAGDNSSIPEIVGARRDAPSGRLYGSALLVDPENAEDIADAAHKLISDKTWRDGIIEKGYENVKRFSWEKCAQEIAKTLVDF